MKLDDYEATIELWPDTEQAFNLFTKIGTQWRMGPKGRSGLDYKVLFDLMGRMKLDEAAYDLLFEDIRILEQQALQTMREGR